LCCTYVLYGVHHLASVVLVLEDSLYCLPSGSDIVEVLLCAPLLLLILVDVCLNLIFGSDGPVDSLDIEDLTLDPVVHVEERVLQVLAKLRD